MKIEPHEMRDDDIAHVENLALTRPTVTSITVRNLLAHIAAQQLRIRELEQRVKDQDEELRAHAERGHRQLTQEKTR